MRVRQECPSFQFLVALNPTESDLGEAVNEIIESIKEDMEEAKARGSSQKMADNANWHMQEGWNALVEPFADKPWESLLRQFHWFLGDVWIPLREIIIEGGDLDGLLADDDDDEE